MLRRRLLQTSINFRFNQIPSHVDVRRCQSTATEDESSQLSFAELTAAVDQLRKQGSSAKVSSAAIQQLAGQCGIAGAADVRAAVIDTVLGGLNKEPEKVSLSPLDAVLGNTSEVVVNDPAPSAPLACRASRWVFLVSFTKDKTIFYCPFNHEIVASVADLATQDMDGRLKLAKTLSSVSGINHAVLIPISGDRASEDLTEYSKSLESALMSVGFTGFTSATAESVIATMKQLPGPEHLQHKHVSYERGDVEVSESRRWFGQPAPETTQQFQAVWASLKLATRQRQQLPLLHSFPSLEAHIVDCVAPLYTSVVAHITINKGADESSRDVDRSGITKINMSLYYLATGRTVQITGAQIAGVAGELSKEAARRPLAVITTYQSNLEIVRLIVQSTQARILLLNKGFFRLEFAQELANSDVKTFEQRVVGKGFKRDHILDEVCRVTGRQIRNTTSYNRYSDYHEVLDKEEEQFETDMEMLEEWDGMHDFVGLEGVMERYNQQKGTEAEDATTGIEPAVVKPVKRESPPHVKEYLQHIYDDPPRKEAEINSNKKLEKYICLAVVGTNRMRHRRAGNPTSLSNHVALMALEDHTGATLLPLRVGSRRGELRLPSLDDYDVLVMHHAKHGLLLLSGPESNTADPELTRFLARGGKVWCTALAEYVLSGFRTEADNKLLSLEGLGTTYGIPTVPAPFTGGDSRSQDAYITESTVTSTTIVTTGGPAIMTPRPTRATTPEERSAASVALSAMKVAFCEQRKTALVQSQMISTLGRMDAMLALTAMERNGMFVDRARLLAQAGEAKNNWLESSTVLDMMLPQQLPLDTTRKIFSWHSPNQVSAFFFGGKIRIGTASPRPDSPELRVSRAIAFTELGFHSHTLPLLVHNPCLRLYAEAQKLQVTDTKNIVETIRTYIALKEHARRTRKTAIAPSEEKRSDKAKREEDEAGVEKDADFGYHPGATKFRVVVLDLEATGLSSHGDRIVEMAFLDPVEDQCFSALVNPQCLIPVAVTALHRITNSMVSNMPSFAGYLPQLQRFLRLGRYRRPDEVLILVGHNSAGLDEPLLRTHFAACGAPLDDEHVLFADSIPMMRQRRSQFKFELGSFRLPQVVKLLGIEKKYQQRGQELHRAETDVRLLWDVLGHLTGTIRQPGAVRHSEVLRLMAETLQQADDSCFSARLEMSTSSNVSLPGQMEQLFGKDAEEKTKELKAFPVMSHHVLSVLANAGSKEAAMLRKSLASERRITSILELDETGRDGTLVHNDGCIRQDVRQMSTTTGRTSSAFPNCHNFPRRTGSRLRELFTSRHEKKGVVVEFDYSQLELRVLMLLSQDPNMLEVEKLNIDWHMKTLSFLHGIPVREAMERYDNADSEIIRLRERCKTVTFTLLFGGGIRRVAEKTGYELSRIKQCRDMLKEAYPTAFTAFAERNRDVLQRPENPGAPTHSVLELPTGCRVTVPSRDVANMTPRLRNVPIQSFGTEVVQLAVGKLYRELLAVNHFDDKAMMINFVHDSVCFDCHEDTVTKLVPLAENTLGSVKDYLKELYPGMTSNIDFPVRATVGESLMSMKPYKVEEWEE